MKKQLRTNLAAKTAAVILTLIFSVLGFWATLLTLYQWDNIWAGPDYYNSNSYYNALYSNYAYVHHFAELLQRQRWGEEFSYLEEQELLVAQTTLAPENTNFRFRLVDNVTGELLYSNLPDSPSWQDLEQTVHQMNYSSIDLSKNDALYHSDYIDHSDSVELFDSPTVSSGSDRAPRIQNGILFVLTESGDYLSFTEDNFSDAAYYGYRYSTGEGWSYYPGLDRRIVTASLAVEYGAIDPLSAPDDFLAGYNSLSTFAPYLTLIALLALILDAAVVALLIFLCLGAGRQSACPDQITLNWFDKLPLDVLACVWAGGFLLLVGLSDQIAWVMNNRSFTRPVAIGLAVLSLGVAALVLSLLLTLATRFKTHTVLSGTLLYRLWGWLRRLLRRFWHWARRTFRLHLPLTWRLVLAFLGYLLVNCFLSMGLFLSNSFDGFFLLGLLAVNGAALLLGCRWTAQWRAVRDGTDLITGGVPDARIDTAHMFPDLREHAEALNDLGSAINSAVEERVKSERMKAELITNVSHDLKTPLTSIINYVDLLKKEDIQDPKALEYLGVLDRKSQQLKKLTEDLVEASKASTGTLAVNLERLGTVQLVNQALGEYSLRFSDADLTPVVTLPEEELYVSADGRYFWRILDNLLGNCVKYALSGTRVYLDLQSWNGNVILTLKNVSSQPLNIPADRLMERFVRGEESRTTEGSGLGLSIARSLTELQGGTFRLDIDGDLFKAVVSFPQIP